MHGPRAFAQSFPGAGPIPIFPAVTWMSRAEKSRQDGAAHPDVFRSEGPWRRLGLEPFRFLDNMQGALPNVALQVRAGVDEGDGFRWDRRVRGGQVDDPLPSIPSSRDRTQSRLQSRGREAHELHRGPSANSRQDMAGWADDAQRGQDDGG